MLNQKTMKITTPNDREILITREFAAPRTLVFEAMSDPELMKRWLSGPPGWSMVECENDMQSGGKFRHVWHGPDGASMAMHGVNREVVPPRRIVRTETFEFGCEMQAGEQLCCLELTEAGGRTKMTLRVTYPSKEARDGALASGMEHGMESGYAQLDALLATT